MRVADFDYHLPEELIAQVPADRRDQSRMMVMRRESGHCESTRFSAIGTYLRPGDCLVINDTKVIPARLFGHRQGTGGRVEAFLLEQVETRRWRCLLRPGRRMKPGATVVIDQAPDRTFTVQARHQDGIFEIEFDTDNVYALLDSAGQVPLPPYIEREASTADRERYQTVYAERPGAVAAPTAGLHFTRDILDDLEQNRGVRTARLTLHVGPGTFRPVKAETIDQHVMHEEVYDLPEDAAEAVNRTRRDGGRVIAVGTTSVRTLETCANPHDRTVTPDSGRTRIFIHPPKRPLVCDGLLTNFHLPRSTLLMLVSTFSSVDAVLQAYDLAIRERFRFYSYGDCMLILPDDS